MTDAAAPAPVAQKDRIPTLDVLRGLAVLGILMVNAWAFSMPQEVSANVALSPFPLSDASALVAWVSSVFFQGKFVTLFSMLFGVSLFLVGGEREDDDRGLVLRRRLMWLLAFGLIHGILLWYGDILTLYALVGFVALLCRSWSETRLLTIGTLIFAVCSVAVVIFGWMLNDLLKSGQLPPDVNLIPNDPAAVRASIENYQNGFSGAFAENFGDWAGQSVGQLLVYSLPTFALMLIGLGLFKNGFLKGTAPAWVYALFVAIGGGALFAVTRLLPGVGEPMRMDAGGGVSFAVTPLVTLGYASVLILLLKAGAGPLLHPLRAAGQMAFTNYLTQSIIMTSIFYGGRGGLFGTMDRPEVLLLVFGIWALQLVWSPLWLSVFSMGPLEWVWRALSYGKAPPLLRSHAGGAAAVAA